MLACAKGRTILTPCNRCKAAAKSSHLIRAGAKWASKEDGLLWYELRSDGATEAVLDECSKEVIDKRDYVLEGHGSQIGEFMSIATLSMLRTAVVIRERLVNFGAWLLGYGVWLLCVRSLAPASWVWGSNFCWLILEHGSYAFGAWFLRSELDSNSFFF